MVGWPVWNSSEVKTVFHCWGLNPVLVFFSAMVVRVSWKRQLQIYIFPTFGMALLNKLTILLGLTLWRAGIAQSIQRLATGWTVRGSNPGVGKIFRARPGLPWSPSSPLYNGYRVSFPRVKRPGRGADHPPSSSAEVKENVQLYLYSPSGPSWQVLGWNLPSLLLYNEASKWRGCSRSFSCFVR